MYYKDKSGTSKLSKTKLFLLIFYFGSTGIVTIGELSKTLKNLFEPSKRPRTEQQAEPIPQTPVQPPPPTPRGAECKDRRMVKIIGSAIRLDHAIVTACLSQEKECRDVLLSLCWEAHNTDERRPELQQCMSRISKKLPKADVDFLTAELQQRTECSNELSLLRQ